MKQGVLTHGRVRLLLSKGHSCYRPRTGERKRKSVRGCIVNANLSVLNLVIVKKGEEDISRFTGTTGTPPGAQELESANFIISEVKILITASCTMS